MRSRLRRLLEPFTRPFGKANKWVDALPAWANAVLLAVVWVILVYTCYLLVLLGPASGWKLAEKLSLGQIVTGLAGFGGGFMALVFAARQLANTLGEFRIDVTIAPTPLEVRLPSRQANALQLVSFEILNVGEVIPEIWQFELSCNVPVSADASTGFEDARPRTSRRGFVCHRRDPIFKGSSIPIGSAYLDIGRPDGLDFRGRTQVTLIYPLTVAITTNRGELRKTFFVNATFDASRSDAE